MERFAGDLSGVLDQLDVRQPVTFCGLSMGGYIGWQFWRHHRSRLQRLVLCDTRAVADADEAAEARLETAEHVLTHGSQSLVDTMIPKLFSPETLKNPGNVVAATQQVMRQTDPEGVAAALRGMAARVDFQATLSRIDVPVLVVCGEDDAISTVTEMRRIADALPQASFVEVPAAGHMSPLEQPATVNAALRDFMS
jgi:pimeloyl-ACP methyl ester carboxylesterase